MSPEELIKILMNMTALLNYHLYAQVIIREFNNKFKNKHELTKPKFASELNTTYLSLNSRAFKTYFR